MVAQFKNYGYIGIFIISLISSATIVVPVPGAVLVAAFGGALYQQDPIAPVFLGLISAAGGTIGETTGYLLGYGGRVVVDNNPTYARMVGWMRRWGAATIFVLALIPNPLFDVAGVVAGGLRFPLWKFYLYGFAGRAPKHILYAYAGVLGFHMFLF